MFFKLFFPEKAPDWSRTFPAKKQNSHKTNVGHGISFQVGKGDGKCVGAQHKRSEFFFLRDERRSFWSWPICGFFGGNFRVLTEETFARSGVF